MRDVILRQHKDRLLTPLVVKNFATIHPNLLSFAGVSIGILSIIAVLHQAYWLGLWLWLINRSLDGLDGLVARIHAKQSDFGGYLDLFLDFVIYAAVPFAFVIAQPTTATLWAGMGLFAAYYLNTISWTILAAILEKRPLQSAARLTSLEMPSGLIEGAETILFYSAFYLWPAHVADLFSLMAILVCFTALQRVWWAYRHLHT